MARQESGALAGRIASSRGVRIAMAVPPARCPSIDDGFGISGTAVDCVAKPDRTVLPSGLGLRWIPAYKAPPAGWVASWAGLVPVPTFVRLLARSGLAGAKMKFARGRLRVGHG
jgi:hypothetical protein